MQSTVECVKEMARRLLLIGCESADWRAIHPLVDAGALPNLQRLIEGGSSGTLAGFAPFQREMLWTSIASGYRARRHGVSGAFEIRADGGGVQPSGRRSWREGAVWDIVACAGMPAAAIGWPATQPGAGWIASVVDDRFAVPRGRDFADWPLPPDCTPHALRSEFRDLRIHSTDIGAAEIAAFLPGLAATNPTDQRLAQIAHMLAEAATIQAAATQLAADASWQFLAIHYRLIDHAQRGFRRLDSAEPDQARFSRGAVDAAYRFQDMLIGGLLDVCGSDTDIVVVSAGRPGILIGHGPSFARDRIVHGASVLDVVPTVLATFGLDFAGDGRVLGTAIAPPLAPSRPAPRPARAREHDGPDLIRSLEALGYRDNISPAQRQAISDAECLSLLNLAEAEMAFDAWREAADLLRRALALRPDHRAAPLLLARCLVLLGEWDACRPIAEDLLAHDPDSLWGNLLQGAIFATAGDELRGAPHLAKARERGAGNAVAQLQLGLLALRLNDAPGAEAHFRAAHACDPQSVESLHGLALACGSQRKLAEAESHLRQAIALHFHFPRAHYQLGLILADQGRVAEATHALRTALQQDPAMVDAEMALRRLVQAQIATLPGGNAPSLGT